MAQSSSASFPFRRLGPSVRSAKLIPRSFLVSLISPTIHWGQQQTKTSTILTMKTGAHQTNLIYGETRMNTKSSTSQAFPPVSELFFRESYVAIWDVLTSCLTPPPVPLNQLHYSNNDFQILEDLDQKVRDLRKSGCSAILSTEVNFLAAKFQVYAKTGPILSL